LATLLTGTESYYEQLRGRLEASAEPGVARELLAAERSGSTSGEILVQTGLILRRLLETGTAERLGMAEEV